MVVVVQAASEGDGVCGGAWKASLLPACEPPLMTLKHGTGSTSLSLPASLAKYWYRGMPSHSAPACSGDKAACGGSERAESWGEEAARLGGRHRDAEDCVGAERRLVAEAVADGAGVHLAHLQSEDAVSGSVCKRAETGRRARRVPPRCGRCAIAWCPESGSGGRG